MAGFERERRGGVKRRLYELDYIKFAALLAVFTVHFTVEMQYNGVNALAQVFPTSLFNIYLGNIGVSLFFICSGAALMYVYGNKLEPGLYYKKRFLGVYPMFWIAFVIMFCIRFVQNRGIDPTIPHWKMIYSILGIDGVALNWGMNYFQVGEWFLGVLICLYVVFPLLRKCFLKQALLTVFGVGILFVLCELFFQAAMPTDCFFIARLPEILFGMIYIRYRKRFGWKTAAAGVIMVAFVSVLPAAMCDNQTCPLLVGIGLFLALSFVFSKIPETAVGKNLCTWTSRYCYAFFLVSHHVVINGIEKKFTGLTVTKAGVWILYFTCFFASVLLSKGLYWLHKKVMDFFKDPDRQKKAPAGV